MFLGKYWYFLHCLNDKATYYVALSNTVGLTKSKQPVVLSINQAANQPVTYSINFSMVKQFVFLPANSRFRQQLPIHTTIYLTAYGFICLSMYLFVYLSIIPSILLPTRFCLFVYLSILFYRCIYPLVSIYLSVYLSICLLVSTHSSLSSFIFIYLSMYPLSAISSSSVYLPCLLHLQFSFKIYSVSYQWSHILIFLWLDLAFCLA